MVGKVDNSCGIGVRLEEAEFWPLADDQHPGVLSAFQVLSGCNIHNTFDPHPKINYPTLSLFLSNELTLSHRLYFFGLKFFHRE